MLLQLRDCFQEARQNHNMEKVLFYGEGYILVFLQQPYGMSEVGLSLPLWRGGPL